MGTLNKLYLSSVQLICMGTSVSVLRKPISVKLLPHYVTGPPGGSIEFTISYPDEHAMLRLWDT